MQKTIRIIYSEIIYRQREINQQPHPELLKKKQAAVSQNTGLLTHVIYAFKF